MQSRRRTVLCDSGCRCVKVQNCAPKPALYPEINFWWNYCQVVKAATADDGPEAGEDSEFVTSEIAADHSIGIEERQPPDMLVEKRNANPDLLAHQLERRHNYAFVCDIDVHPNEQRRVTTNCRHFGLNCNSGGRMTGTGVTQYCDTHCRCVNVVARCDIKTIGIPGFSSWQYWQQYCQVGKSVTADDDHSTRLERRHNYAFVCDIGINPNHQRQLTDECRSFGMSCNAGARVTGKGHTRLCDGACRCVNVVARCSLPKLKGYWQQFCSTPWKRFGADAMLEAADEVISLATGEKTADEVTYLVTEEEVTGGELLHILEKDSLDPATVADAGVEPTMKCFGNANLLKECVDFDYTCTADGLMRSNGDAPVERCEKECSCVSVFEEPPSHSTLMERQSSLPTQSPGQLLCTDSDSFHDPDVPEKCKSLAWYGCDNDGKVTRPTSLQDCEMACICVQEPGQTLRPSMLEARTEVSPDKDVPAFLASRDDLEPTWGPWRVWCADADSVHDPLLGGNCQHLWKYRCNDQGNITRPAERKECEKGCMCIQEPLHNVGI